ncbi:ZN543-like protein [Mya arenaria]|uniref:ZN543-like protein n=1 Tax=Mya arenaria TaxID=6604 RepID=A0ABY7F1I7_MYAAR|nr:ZN543-like protein [Mya arenaria]
MDFYFKLWKRWPSYVKPKVASKHSNSISMETSFELPAYLESSQLNSQWQPDMDSFTQANMDSFIQPNISVKYEANFEQFCRRGRRSSGHPRLLNLYKYACTYCGRLFQSNRNRLRHELIHTNEKPFECSVCGMRFNQKHSMKNHEKRHLAKNCVKMK